MSVWLLLGSALVAIGLTGLLVHASVVRKLLGFNVMGGGVFLLLLALAPQPPGGTADPIAQALVLTGIVIAIAATALGVLLVRRYESVTGRDDLADDEGVGTDD